MLIFITRSVSLFYDIQMASMKDIFSGFDTIFSFPVNVPFVFCLVFMKFNGPFTVGDHVINFLYTRKPLILEKSFMHELKAYFKIR